MKIKLIVLRMTTKIKFLSCRLKKCILNCELFLTVFLMSKERTFMRVNNNLQFYVDYSSNDQNLIQKLNNCLVT